MTGGLGAIPAIAGAAAGGALGGAVEHGGEPWPDVLQGAGERGLQTGLAETGGQAIGPILRGIKGLAGSSLAKGLFAGAKELPVVGGVVKAPLAGYKGYQAAEAAKAAAAAKAAPVATPAPVEAPPPVTYSNPQVGMARPLTTSGLPEAYAPASKTSPGVAPLPPAAPAGAPKPPTPTPVIGRSASMQGSALAPTPKELPVAPPVPGRSASMQGSAIAPTPKETPVAPPTPGQSPTMRGSAAMSPTPKEVPVSTPPASKPGVSNSQGGVRPPQGNVFTGTTGTFTPQAKPLAKAVETPTFKEPAQRTSTETEPLKDTDLRPTRPQEKPLSEAEAANRKTVASRSAVEAQRNGMTAKDLDTAEGRKRALDIADRMSQRVKGAENYKASEDTLDAMREQMQQWEKLGKSMGGGSKGFAK